MVYMVVAMVTMVVAMVVAMVTELKLTLPNCRVDNARKDTTPTHAVFGGKLVSTVTCTQCHHQSNTNECFLELGLDVRVSFV